MIIRYILRLYKIFITDFFHIRLTKQIIVEFNWYVKTYLHDHQLLCQLPIIFFFLLQIMETLQIMEYIKILTFEEVPVLRICYSRLGRTKIEIKRIINSANCIFFISWSALIANFFLNKQSNQPTVYTLRTPSGNGQDKA